MRIGLIAMSGIRVCDAELLRLGLTLPGFVERSKTIASLPSLGLLTLAGMTPDRHEVRYVEMPALPPPDQTPRDFDLVAISTYSAQVDEAYELGDRYRALGIPTVIGGPHVSHMPDEATAHCHAVVVGEGEAVWEGLLEDAENGRLKERYGSLDSSFDLARAPVPAFELLDIGKYNRLTVQTSRGCPHACEFCASSVLLTRRYKQKPVERVLEELVEIRRVWKQPFIEFADDNSLVNKAYWKRLLPKLAEMDLRWFAETDISVAEDKECLDLMRESGCAQVLIGLESPTRSALDGLDRGGNWKWKRWPGYREAIAKIQSHGITVNGCFILGLDQHTPEIFDQVFDFVRDAGLYEVQVTLQTAFPGTPLYARLRKERRLIREGDWKMCTLFDVNFRPANMDADTLVKGFRELVVRLYSEDFTTWRRNQYRRQLRHALKAQRREA